MASMRLSQLVLFPCLLTVHLLLLGCGSSNRSETTREGICTPGEYFKATGSCPECPGTRVRSGFGPGAPDYCINSRKQCLEFRGYRDVHPGLLRVGICETPDRDTIVDKTELSEWGYRSSDNVTYSAMLCGNSLSPQKTVHQSIKSLASLQGHSNTYYRFTLAMEEYETSDEVRRRLNELEHPIHRSSKHAKLCNLRKSFAAGKRVYFVHTDASLFLGELPRILERLRINAAK